MKPEFDKSIVSEGPPAEGGLHLLWSYDVGWPVISIVRVEIEENGHITFWKGCGGTDSPSEMKKMFGIYGDFLGHSRVTPEAIAYYEDLWFQTTEANSELWAKRGGM